MTDFITQLLLVWVIFAELLVYWSLPKNHNTKREAKREYNRRYYTKKQKGKQKRTYRHTESYLAKKLSK